MISKTPLLALLLTAPLALLARADNAPVTAPTSIEAPATTTRTTSSKPAVLPSGPTADQATAAKLVYGLLSDSRYAYRPQPLDDALSADIYKRYLEALDGGKQFFTAADIAGFDRYKTRLDDAIKSGELEPGYAIFALYRERVNERIRHARGLLKQDIFDFSGDEQFHYDRKKAPWAQDTAELDELWKQSVRNDWLRLKLAGKESKDIAKTLDKRYANLADNVAQLEGQDVFQTFLNSYTNAIDPHTSYFTPRSAENFNLSMSLSLEGIGAVLQKQDDIVAIREIVPGGPADKSGVLAPGDRVVAVGQGTSGTMEDVIGWRIDNVVEKIRGPKDSKVRLDVVPASAGLDSEPVRVVITRDKVRLEDQAAKSKVLEIPGIGDAPAKHVGVIELPGFYQDFEGRRLNNGDYASATRDVAKLLVDMKKQGVDGVVLDLRNNGGGSLNEAIELTGLFIDQGPVVQVRESGGRVTVNGDDEPGVAWDGPLAVLVNRGSASASEIFAGAIQDYGRGLVIGENTFGKGTVQNLVDLDRWPGGEEERFGQVKLTVAQFFLPGGSSTQNKGVVPDIQFPASVDASEYGESTYDNALPWTRIAAVPHKVYGDFSHILGTLDKLHTARVANNLEFQWWREDVARFREESAKTTISLNEAERRRERDASEARRKKRQETREELGLALDPLALISADDGLTANERDIVQDAAREKAAEDRPDPLLQESAAILADAIHLLANDRKLSALVLPISTRAGHWAD
ncbi:carboxy terminal-processing peptidase [Lysobacter sp. H23M47]|uniref:carboxy terminal-processing peptidase n=1 Tax=Lysobacter sp. H23M47 TaxID=2781024 RepID=UPI00187E9338|nr:carboxy terminal-processing peptidase [Lysobacter sp. H23M47]QOW24323.1 carboxy terminal-processing peptidase [Lysobacter sp. H23M47]